MENDPRPFDLTSPSERARLMSETVGYAHTSLNYGTDIPGRQYAYDALRAALAQGYRLVPPSEKVG